MATRCRGSRSGISGRFACLTIFLCSTIVPSLAGFEGHGARESRGGLVRPTLRTGSVVPRDNQVSRSTLGGGYRVGFMSNFRSGNAPAIMNRERSGSQDSSVPSSVDKMAGTGNRESAPQIRNPDSSGALPSFTGSQHGPRLNPAGINDPTKRRSQAPSLGAAEARAKINNDFERYEQKIAAQPWKLEERRDRLERSRVFLGNLIDLGYEPLLIDTWCDDLLDDEVDTGMPMDLVDLYWGPPVDTQQFVEYNVPYEISTYRNGEGDYRQVTSKDRIVSQPMYNGADLNNR
jgi:hypothetical protein